MAVLFLPEQKEAMKALNRILKKMEATGLGSDAISIVLDTRFKNICADMARANFTSNWRKREDPFSEHPLSEEASRFIVEEIVP
jgi:hypothetical protein